MESSISLLIFNGVLYPLLSFFSLLAIHTGVCSEIYSLPIWHEPSSSVEVQVILQWGVFLLELSYSLDTCSSTSLSSKVHPKPLLWTFRLWIDSLVRNQVCHPPPRCQEGRSLQRLHLWLHPCPPSRIFSGGQISWRHELFLQVLEDDGPSQYGWNLWLFGSW